MHVCAGGVSVTGVHARQSGTTADVGETAKSTADRLGGALSRQGRKACRSKGRDTSRGQKKLQRLNKNDDNRGRYADEIGRRGGGECRPLRDRP